MGQFARGREMMKWIAEASPSLKARMAGAFYLLTMLTAAFTEIYVRVRGKLNFGSDLAAGIVEISGMVAVTLLLYAIFKPVNSRVSLLAAFFNLVALTFEAFKGYNIGLVFHGFFCLLIGYLIFRGNFLPRILAALMAFGGWGWLTFLSTSLADHLSPYNMASAFVGEGLVMLWLLVMGVNVHRWKEQANAVGQHR
jgi:hypothetical protein